MVPYQQAMQFTPRKKKAAPPPPQAKLERGKIHGARVYGAKVHGANVVGPWETDEACEYGEV